MIVCGAGTDDKFISVTAVASEIEKDADHELKVYLPWALCEQIHDAYEHELAGVDHEAEITDIKEVATP